MSHFKGAKDGKQRAQDRYADGGLVERRRSPLGYPSASAYGGPTESLDFPPPKKPTEISSPSSAMPRQDDISSNRKGK